MCGDHYELYFKIYVSFPTWDEHTAGNQTRKAPADINKAVHLVIEDHRIIHTIAKQCTICHVTIMSHLFVTIVALTTQTMFTYSI